ncbi:MAG: helix-turn-helix domain-containing protein [Rickettsiales bacterium]
MNKDYNLLNLVDGCIEEFFNDHKGSTPDSGLLSRIVSEVEKRIICKTLEHTSFNQSKTSQILGINRNTLRNKIQNYKINVK